MALVNPKVKVGTLLQPETCSFILSKNLVKASQRKNLPKTIIGIGTAFSGERCFGAVYPPPNTTLFVSTFECGKACCADSVWDGGREIKQNNCYLSTRKT